MRKTIACVSAVLILAGSLVLVAHMFSQTAVRVINKGHVKVKGFAHKSIKSDLAIFRAMVTEEDISLKDCYLRLTQDKKRAEAFFKRSGFTEDEMELYPASITEKYRINDRGFATDEFWKYILSQEFKIESRDVDRVERMSAEISDLLNEGVKLFVSRPEYVYTDLDDLKLEMIGKATENAKERANIIAKEGKFKLGPIASVRVGVFQITPANSTDISDYGINDTTSIQKEIKCVVEIEYFVK